MKSLYCQCSVSLFFLETKATGGDIGAGTGQQLGVLSRDPFVQNIQGYEMSNKNFRNGGHPLDIKLPADASSRHPPGHQKTSSPFCHGSDEMTGGCSLCLIKGIEECPSTGNPALSCLTPVGWVISNQSCACLPVTSDKGPSDP